MQLRDNTRGEMHDDERSAMSPLTDVGPVERSPRPRPPQPPKPALDYDPELCTYELRGVELDDAAHVAKLARAVEPGELVYCPLSDVVAFLGFRLSYADPLCHVERVDDWTAPLVRPARPDPRRVDKLRAALHQRGLDLVDEQAFYWRVVPR